MRAFNFVIVSAVILLPGSGRTQVIDRSCVHAVDGDLRDRIQQLAAELPADDKRRQDYAKLREERERLGVQAARAESEFVKAMQAATNRVAARNPGMSTDSLEFKRQAWLETYGSHAVDHSNASMITTQFFGYNDTEGRQHQLLKTLPVPKAEFEAKVQQLMRIAPSVGSPGSADDASKQLLVVVEASKRAGDGRPIEDWMLSVPPTVAETPMETSRRSSGTGFDTAGAVSDADELRRLMAAVRGREERQALDVAHLPRYLPAAVVRHDWVLQKSPRMVETKRQAAAVVGRIIADDDRLQRVRQIFRNDPPPPEVTAPRDPQGFKKGAGTYIRTVIQQLKPVIYELIP